MTNTKNKKPSELPTEAGEVVYYLVGRVPVEMQERPDGVVLRAFNPLLGGFVSDARYYTTIKRHEHDEDGVQRIDQAAFERSVEELRRSHFYPAVSELTASG